MSVAYSMDIEVDHPLPDDKKHVGFTTDSRTLSALTSAFNLLGFADPDSAENGLRDIPPHEAFALMQKGNAIELVIIDIDDCMDLAETISTMKSTIRETARIIAVGSENDIHLYRDLIAEGVEDYLIKPVTAESLVSVIQAPRKSKPRSDDPVATEQSPTASLVIGTRGGIGTSALAASLAWHLAHDRDAKTSLLDLDLQFGVSALSFDLEASAGLREALATPDRLDSLLMESAIIQESKNLKLLGAEDDLSLNTNINTQALGSLFTELRVISEHIIVDMPKHLLSCHADALSSIDHVFLLTDQTLNGLRDTVRIHRFLQKAAPKADIHLVLSDGIAATQQQFSEDQFEHSIGQSIEFTFPSDATAAAEATSLGKPIIAATKTGSFSSAIDDMGLLLCGEQQEEEPSNTSLLGKLKGMLGS